VMAPPQLSVSLALTEAVSVKLDRLFGRIVKSCVLSIRSPSIGLGQSCTF
jgi:hypothetical protein